MGFEHLIGSLKQEQKTLISQEMQRRKTLLDKIKSSNTNDFDEIYRQEKQKLENKQNLM